MEESHHRLDEELQQLLKRHVLTPQEEILKKQIQKEKLGKERSYGSTGSSISRLHWNKRVRPGNASPAF